MKGVYLKRKLNKFCRWLKERPYEIRRFFTKLFLKNRNFTIISNNCWAGRVYQYLDMPYLSPTVGLYFFAPDYIKFVSDLRRYLEMSLEFIEPSESKYYEVLKERNQTDKPIGLLDDVEIVFLHYKSQAEAKEKWERRKARVNFNNIIIKMSRMDLCTEKEIQGFDSLPFKNKFFLNNCLPLKYKSEVYWKEEWHEEGIYRDTEPFPGNISLVKLLGKKPERYNIVKTNGEMNNAVD